MNSTAPQSICISVGPDQLEGYLDLPEAPRGLVIFAQSCGSGRHNAMNNRMASLLWRRRFATLLVDLIDWPVTSSDTAPDMAALARRLDQVTAWVRLSPLLRDLPRGYFASDAGAGAAIRVAATALDIDAMVMLDIPVTTTVEQLKLLKSPTLFISTDKAQHCRLCSSEAIADMKATHGFVLIDDGIIRTDGQMALQEISCSAIDWLEQHFLVDRPIGAS